MIGWGCGWDMSSRGCGCMGGILSRWEGTRAEAGADEDFAEVGWSAEVDSGGHFKEIVCGGV